jgi:hypothetical protein
MDMMGGQYVNHENQRGINQAKKKEKNNKNIWAIYEPQEKTI